MAKQAAATSTEHPNDQREQQKVVRRRSRRRPSQSRNRSEDRGRSNQIARQPAQNATETVAAWTRAPRPAEPPPRNPRVFSYTYTTWKTS